MWIFLPEDAKSTALSWYSSSNPGTMFCFNHQHGSHHHHHHHHPHHLSLGLSASRSNKLSRTAVHGECIWLGSDDYHYYLYQYCHHIIVVVIVIIIAVHKECVLLRPENIVIENYYDHYHNDFDNGVTNCGKLVREDKRCLVQKISNPSHFVIIIIRYQIPRRGSWQPCLPWKTASATPSFFH